MSAPACRVTSELNAYLRDQDKLEVTDRDYQQAKVAALLATFERDQSPATEYTGLELVAEAVSEHQRVAYRPLLAILKEAVEGAQTLDKARKAIDEAELGRYALSLLWPYLEQHAEKNHEKFLPPVDPEPDPDAEYEARRDAELTGDLQ